MYDIAELAEVRRQVEERAADLLLATQSPAGGLSDSTVTPPAACLRLAEAELIVASLHPPCIVRAD